MADVAFGGVEKLVKVALAIQEAVETVKQNNKECRAIEKCATRCTALLQRLKEQTGMMEDEVTGGPLEDMAECLEVALELVKKCQRKRYLSHLWKAGGMEKKLLRAQDDLLRKLHMADFAGTVHMLTNNQNVRAASPQPTPPPSEEVCHVSPLRQEAGGYYVGRPCHHKEAELFPSKKEEAELCGLGKIVRVGLIIKRAVETVKQNKAECRDIDKCVARCTALLLRIEEYTDTMKDEAMRGKLEDVANSLEEALQLVKLCQGKRYLSHLWKELRRVDTRKELRRVQDDILQKVQIASYAATVQTTIKNAVAAPPQQPLPPPPTEEVVPAGKEVTSSFLQ